VGGKHLSQPGTPAGVARPLREDLDDAELEARLFPPPPTIAADQRQMPDWGWVHRELCRPNLTLTLLWVENRAGAPGGFGYSLVLRLVQGLGGPAEADDAPDPSCR
jgi:transposase